MDAPCTSFALPVRMMRLSCRSPVPNFALQAAHLQATANRCWYDHLPGRHPTPELLMLVAQEAASLRRLVPVACMINRLFTTRSCVGTPRAIVCGSKSALRHGARGTGRSSGTNGGRLPRVAATQELRSQLYRHRLPVHLVSIHCQVLRPASCQSIVRLVATVSVFWLSPLHWQAVPTSSVFDPSMGPKYLPSSNRESRGPDGGWMAAKASNPHSLTELCKGRNGAPHHTNFVCCLAVSTNRKTDGACCGGIRHKPNQQNHGPAGTSTPVADITASLIGHAPDLSAAPLD